MVRPRRREDPLSEYAVIQTQFRDAAVLAAALTDLGFPARAIEWHEKPAVLRGPTIEVAAYAQLVIRGRHVGPGADDLGFIRGRDGVFHALVGTMEQRTPGGTVHTTKRGSGGSPPPTRSASSPCSTRARAGA
jgi:hypothetical protein